MFKKLDIYVFKNFLTLFLGTFVICIFILMMQFLWKYIDDLVGKGLEIDILAKFFFYAGETLVSMALPLAILLAALISFGNMGERLELLAMKAAGINLIRIMRPIAILMAAMVFVSYYFQDYAAPHAQRMLYQMLFSMRQTSPTIDIPEGVFYDGIDGVNLYVKEKNPDTNMLYEVIIYELSEGPTNARIIIADSALLETAADRQHLLLHLYNGEQFENLRNNAMRTNDVPYRRETFVDKHFIIDFSTEFSMTDNDFSHSAKTKNMGGLVNGIDSMENVIDSTALAYYDDLKRGTLNAPGFTRQQNNFTATQSKRLQYYRQMFAHTQNDSLAWTDSMIVDSIHRAIEENVNDWKDRVDRRVNDLRETKEIALARDSMPRIDDDSAFLALTDNNKADVMQKALQKVSLAASDMKFRQEMMDALKRDRRLHEIQIWQKLSLALACLIFFFIGAPLGAIIRKGGLGMPVVVAVVIFLFYYIVNSFGSNLALSGTIPTWLGMWFSTFVLAPIAYYLTVKSNNDSVVFNIDTYHNAFKKLFGIRTKRNVYRKEVIINDPDYHKMENELALLIEEAKEYRRTKHLTRFPNYINVFFKNGRDEQIEEISGRMEMCVEELSNSKDRQILKYLNGFPVIDTYAHTAPFKNNKWNQAAGYFFPVGLTLLFRINRFRHRLSRDLKDVIKTGDKLAGLCRQINVQA